MDKKSNKDNMPDKSFLYRDKEMKIIYKEKNIPVIDLHRMTEGEAADWCNHFMMMYRGQKVEFIVGKGNHSKNGPVLKDFVKSVLEDRGIKHGEVVNNKGRIYAYLT